MKKLLILLLLTSFNLRAADPQAGIMYDPTTLKSRQLGVIQLNSSFSSIEEIRNIASNFSTNIIELQGLLAPNDGRGGHFVVTNTVANTNLGTRIQITATHSLDRIREDEDLLVRWFGAKGDPTEVYTTQLQNAFNAATTLKAALAFHDGTFYSGPLYATNINIKLSPGTVVKALTNSSSHLINVSYTKSGRISGGNIDGNMVNQSTGMSGGAGTNWWSGILVKVTEPNAQIDIFGVTFTNYVYAGVKVEGLEGHLNLEKNIFIDGRQHGGTVGLLTTAIHMTQPSVDTNSIGKIRIVDNDFIQTTIPASFQRGPGGIIVAGNENLNAKFTGIIRGNYFKHIGQTWVGNHIAAVDLYEECYNVIVTENVFDTCFYDPAKIQNINEVTISNNQFIGDNDTNHNPGVLIWYNPQQRTEFDGDKHGVIISGNLFKDYPKAQAINLLNSLTNATATMTDVIIAFNRSTNVARGIKLGDTAGGEHYGPLTIIGNHFFVNGTEANAVIELESFHGHALIKDNYLQVSSTAAVGSHGFKATIDITGARFFMDGNVIKTVGTGYYPISIFGADYISLGKADLYPATGGDAIRIDSRTEDSITYNNGTVWYNSSDVVLNNSGVANIVWATVTNRVDNENWFYIDKANQAIGIGVDPTTHLNPLVIRRQTNGLAQVTVTNDPDLGNTLAAAGVQVLSKDSAGRIAAYPSDYVSAFLRDAFVITGNSSASTGVKINTEIDTPITFLPNNTTSMTITDDLLTIPKPINSFSLTVVDDAYAAGWNASTNVPTKNAVYDKIEALVLGAGSSTIYLDGSSITAPNFTNHFAVFDSTNIVIKSGAVLTNLIANNVSVDNEVYSGTWSASTNVPTKMALYERIEDIHSRFATITNGNAFNADQFTIDSDDLIAIKSGALVTNLITDTEVYGAGWDSDNSVPTKDALYDKIETLSGGGGSFNADQFTTDAGGDTVIKPSALVTNFISAGSLRFSSSSTAVMFTNTAPGILKLRLADDSDHADLFVDELDVYGFTEFNADVQFDLDINVIGDDIGFSGTETLLSNAGNGDLRFHSGAAITDWKLRIGKTGDANDLLLKGDSLNGTLSLRNEDDSAYLDFLADDITVTTEAYDATGWNGDNTVPTKNAIRDKIETMGGGSSPTTTRGDMIRRGAAADERLAVGTLGQSIISDGTDPAWFSFKNFRRIFDDFIAGTTSGETGWALASGSGSHSINNTAEAERPGQVILSTSTSSSGAPSMSRSLTSILLGGGIHVFETAVKLSDLSDGTETYIVRVGFHDLGVDGAWFEYTHSVNAGEWEVKTASNSTTTTVDTNVAATTNWTTLRVEVNADGTLVTFYIDGASVGTSSTNIPTVAGRYTGTALRITKSAGTTARTLTIDYTEEIFKPTTPR